MTPAQKNAYLEAHVAVQSHMAQAMLTNATNQNNTNNQTNNNQQTQSHHQHSLSTNLVPALITTPTKMMHPKDSSSESNVNEAHVNAHNNHQMSAQNMVASSNHPPPLVSTVVQQYINTLKVPSLNLNSSTSENSNNVNASAESTFTVPDDGNIGYEGGVKVLQSLGNW